MKIDSPTFLTETTFVSASVQFSSGSQKFGNTSDDTHQFTGSISVSGNVNGSSTSTGSFGRVDITSTAGAIVIPNGTQGLVIGDQPYHGYLKYSSTGNQILAARSNGVHGATIIQNDSNKGRLGINTNNAVNSFYGTGDQDIVLMVEGNISSSGNFITTGNVSGSSTSTGSFGMVHTEGVRGLDGNYSTALLVPDTLRFGNDTDSEFRRRTSNEVEFRMAGTDMVRINTTGLFVEAGSLEVESGNVIASGNISGSSTSTGSFAHIRGGGGTTTDNQTKVSFEISSRKKYAENGRRHLASHAVRSTCAGPAAPHLGESKFAGEPLPDSPSPGASRLHATLAR